MKRTLTLLSICLMVFLSNAQTGALDGTGYAPDFTVTDINGNTHTVYDYLDSGYVMVLEILSTSCGHCQQHALGTENSYQTNGPNGTNVARFLGLEVNSYTDSAALANFAVTYGASFPIANNVSPVAINYQLYYTPGYYVIYPDKSYTTICYSGCIASNTAGTIEGLLNNAIGSWSSVRGCTDPTALNYDSLATIDNDSCNYSSYTITTVGMSFSPDTIVCDVDDTIFFNLNPGHNAVEVSDTTWLNNGSTALAGGFNFGYGATGYYIPDDCHTFYYVCQPHASLGMKGVIIAHHPPVYGCTDSLASNYDSTATIDDGSCTYSTNTSDLFISEYGEGSGNNKYIEIYNGTGQDISLSDYEIWKITNGGSWPEYTLSLSGTLLDGEVYVIHNTSSSINSAISSVGNLTWSQASFNGDDALALAKQGIIIDVIGEDGSDPGHGWDVAGVTNATKDHTLVRKCNVTQGNSDWTASSGVDSLSSEWIVLSQNDWSDIGQHTYPCQSIVVNGCTDPLANNYNSAATNDDGSCDYTINGCTDSTASNYNSAATINDGSCVYCIYGCLDNFALNYDSTATCSDSSCSYS